MQTFTKRRPAGRGAYPYEAASLAWLAAADGAPVVAVVAADEGRIELARLVAAPLGEAAAWRLGEGLARTHDAGAPAFGAPPPGWSGDGWVGHVPLPLGEVATWGEMYAELRCRPCLRTARDRGDLGADEARLVDAVLDKVAAGAYDDEAPPARIHGDLWSGNAFSTPDGVVLIDPAAHGGHRVTDLAMLALFGYPRLGTVVAAYEAASRHLPDGWRELVALHQLHPLLVHTVLFGGGYGAQAVAAAAPYA